MSRAEARRAADAARAEAASAADAHLVTADPHPASVSTADGEAVVAARTVGVQTKYRDGEAQTDPFTADYTVAPGQDPEVLAVAHLRFGGAGGASLPAGTAEVALVRRLRGRRELEASLPPMTDEAGFAVRKRLMQRQELEDWRFREGEMDAANGARVEAVASALEERERRREFESDARVEALRAQLEAEKEEALRGIRRKRTQALRKLARDREAAERKADAVAGTSVAATTRAAAVGTGSAALTGPGGAGGASSLARGGGATRRRHPKRSGRDIIADYADPGSAVFAPRRRDGAQRDRIAVAARFDVSAVAPVRGAVALNALDAALPASAVTARVARPGAGPGASGSGRRSTALAPRGQRSEAKRAAAVAADIERVHALLSTTRPGDVGPKAAALTGLTGTVVGGGAGAGSSAAGVAKAAVTSSLGRSRPVAADVPSWRRAKALAARPSTPSFEEEDETEAEAELEQAVLLLQRLLRGRADQNRLSEGKERRMDLIGEIRLDLLRAAERRTVEEEEGAVDAARRLRADEDAALSAIAGSAGSATLDFLAKELVRSEQQRRVRRLASRARDSRRRREAEEAGRRQAEEGVRAKRDMVWRQLCRVHEVGAASLVREAVDGAVADAALAAAEAAVRGEGAAAGGGSGGLGEDLVRAAAEGADVAATEAGAEAEGRVFAEAAKGAIADAGLSPRPDDGAETKDEA